MSTKTIKWIMAHEPLDIFLRAAQKFATVLAEKSNNEINVEVLTVNEYIEKYNNGVNIDYFDLVSQLNDGKFEMSQMYTHVLGTYSPELYMLDLPFLFKDDNHASRVLDGEIGQYLLSGLQKNPDSENVKGLSFTYSGGFTVLAASKDINSIEDLRGIKVRTPYSPVVVDYFKELGLNPIKLELGEIQANLEAQNIEGLEITYRRLYEACGQSFCRSIINSKHNVFLTSIIINKDFWDGLTPELQKCVQESALLAAQEERNDTIEDDVVHRAKCLEDGIKVKEMPEKLQQDFEAAAERVYINFRYRFPPGVLTKIKLA